MDAIQACDIVVTTLKASRLNFFLQESPFAITINIKKTFIKNHAGIEICPEVENLSCMNCIMAARKHVVKHTTEENNDKVCDLEDTIQELSIKLEKAEKELSEVMVDKNTLLENVRDITDARTNEKDEHELKLKHFQSELEKKNKELIKESERNKLLRENFLLVEAQLENLKYQEKKVIYNVETNNNFEILDVCDDKLDAKDTNAEKMVEKTKVNHSNYKEFLKNFLENFKENPDDDTTKYSQAALKMLKKGHNIFHVSLLDIGLYNQSLKAFLNGQSREELHIIEKDCKELVMAFGESLGKGTFKKDTSVFINPKNYGQTWPKKSN